MTTRNGKIARLPKAARHELNCRLSEGEPGASLVGWLNERDDVKTVLVARGQNTDKHAETRLRSCLRIKIQRVSQTRIQARVSMAAKQRRSFS